MRPSGVGRPPPVGTSQTNFACSPGSMPGGIAWNLRCAISTSWSQLRTLVRHALQADIAVAIFDVLLRAFEIVRGDRDQRVLDLARRAGRGAAEHDRHAAADRAVRRQRLQRVGVDHADVAGSRSRTSPMTVDTSVSWPWPDDDVPMMPVIAPERSTRTRQESIQVVVSFFGIEQRLEGGVAAARLEAGRDADAGEPAGAARRVALRAPAPGSRSRPAPCRARCGSRRNRRSSRSGSCTGNSSLRIRFLLPQRDPVHVQVARHAVHACVRARNWSAPGRSRAPLPAASCWSSPRPARRRSRAMR